MRAPLFWKEENPRKRRADSEKLYDWLRWKVADRIRMESNGRSNSKKSLERLISRRALQIGSSTPCITWVLGFFCDVYVMYLFGVALPPIQIPLIQSVYPPLQRAILWNSTLTHTENLIGKGGHAEVYKGRLADGQFVAVKRLTKGGNKEDRISDFLFELGIIAHVNHPNAAQLLGFSVEGGLHLVLQFSHHGSLASVLHGWQVNRLQLCKCEVNLLLSKVAAALDLQSRSQTVCLCSKQNLISCSILYIKS